MAEQRPAAKARKLKGTPVLEHSYVKEQLGVAFKWPGGAPPASLVNAITKTGSPRKLKETLLALKRIEKAAGRYAYGAFKALENRDVAKMFGENPTAFARIAKSIGKYSYGAFGALRNKDIAKMFSRDPSELIRYFGEIAKATGDGAGEALLLLEAKVIARRFEKDPPKVIGYFKEMSKAAGKKARNAFETLRSNKVLTWKFARNPDVILRIVKATGKGAVNAFYALGDRNISGKFTRDHSKFEKMAEVYGEDTGLAIMAFDVAKPNNMFRHPHDIDSGEMMDAIHLTRALGAHYDSPEVVSNFAYAIDMVGEEKTKALYNEFGIEFFARYTKETLEDVYNKIGDESDHRPVLLIAYNKNDQSGSFYINGENIEGLMKSKYYNTIIVEVKNEDEFYDRVLEVSDKYFGIEALIVGAHGEADRIILGRGGEEALLDLSDGKEMERLSDCFVNKPLIILESCHTGDNEEAIGAEISRIWGARLFAQTASSGVKSFETNKRGQIVSVTYVEGGTEFNSGVEKRKKK